MIAAALAKYLDANVAGLTFDESGVTGNVFVATMPSTPDEAVAVIPSGGVPTLGAYATDEPTVQLLVRSAQYDPRPGLTVAAAIYGAVQNLHDVTLDEGGDHEVYVSRCLAAQSGPVPIGADENDRAEWSLNFALRVRNPTTHRT